MDKEILLKGLSAQPSEYGVDDGKVGGCLNLINENGSLTPIRKSVHLGSIPSGSRVYMHKTGEYCHYIIYDNKDWLWTDNNNIYDSDWRNKTPERKIDVGDIPVNQVVTLNNTICFICDSNIIYAIWKDDRYIKFDINDFSFSVNLFQCVEFERTYTSEVGYDEINDCFIPVCESGHDVNILGVIYKNNNDNITEAKFINNVYTRANKTRNIFNAVDSALNLKNAEIGNKNYLKYIHFGVAMIKLYDGRYILSSDLFVLGPKNMPKCYKISRKDDAIYNIEQDNTLYRSNISISLNNIIQGKNFSDIIQGVTVFLSLPQSMYDIDKSYTCSKFSGDDDFSQYRRWILTFDYVTGKKQKELIDNLTFYKSVDIDYKDFDREIDLLEVDATNESISLADFYRYRYGGKTAFVYNNRLHIGDVNKRLCDRQPSIGYNLLKPTADDSVKDPYSYWMGQQIKDTSIAEYAMKITTKRNGINKYVYCYEFSNTYPVNPIITFPGSAIQADIYIYSHKDNAACIYHGIFSLTESQTMGFSYYINTIAGIPRFGVQGKNNLEKLENFDEGLKEFNLYKTKSKEENCISDHNMIKVSEEGNPIYFKASDSITVGSGKIIGLASVAKPLSEGQFGEYPLYVFTDNYGIWAASLQNTGTYLNVRPISQDTTNNSESITPVSDSIIYVGNRGIMMLSGRNVICISDILDGPSYWEDLPYMKEILSTSSIEKPDIQDFREFIKTGCKICYDYGNQRIFIYNSKYGYSYVYSLCSKEWGMMQSDQTGNINNYPETLMLERNKDLEGWTYISTYNNTTYDNNPIPIFFVTRPLKLDAPDVFKTVTSAIIRGTFMDKVPSSAIWGSNDIKNWSLIWTSKDNYLRGFSGSGYKYFCIGAVGTLKAVDTITKISTNYILRMTDKMR